MLPPCVCSTDELAGAGVVAGGEEDLGAAATTGADVGAGTGAGAGADPGAGSFEANALASRSSSAKLFVSAQAARGPAAAPKTKPKATPMAKQCRHTASLAAKSLPSASSGAGRGKLPNVPCDCTKS